MLPQENINKRPCLSFKSHEKETGQLRVSNNKKFASRGTTDLSVAPLRTLSETNCRENNISYAGRDASAQLTCWGNKPD